MLKSAKILEMQIKKNENLISNVPLKCKKNRSEKDQITKTLINHIFKSFLQYSDL